MRKLSIMIKASVYLDLAAMFTLYCSIFFYRASAIAVKCGEWHIKVQLIL